ENFYHLNESAVDLWLSLETPKTVLELAQVLAKKYAGHAKLYQKDVMDWIDDTKQKGILITMENVNATTHA
ncbi:PqqD family protein, partial [Klebsiella pneumoniae]|uniref:PqqD family protein n=1 Tax=Klebsiella pneumoniae TaxID=573 RepID=UPI00117BAC4B